MEAKCLWGTFTVAGRICRDGNVERLVRARSDGCIARRGIADGALSNRKYDLLAVRRRFGVLRVLRCVIRNLEFEEVSYSRAIPDNYCVICCQ